VIALVVVLLAATPAPAPEPEPAPTPIVAIPAEGCLLALREARLLEMAGKFEEARSRLERAVTEFPLEIMPLIALLEHHRRAGSPAAAPVEVRARLRERLADPAVLLPLSYVGFLVSDAGSSPDDLEAILTAVDRRLASRPADVDLLEARIQLLLKLDRPIPARESVAQLVQVRPDPWTLWRAAVLDERLERWDEAIALYRRILGATTDGALFHRMSIARLLVRTGRCPEALDEVEPLLARADTRSFPIEEVLLPCAWSLRDAGDHAAAERILRRVVAAEPEQAEARGMLLHFYASREERAEQSAALADRWANEDDPFALVTEGVTRLAAGNARDALVLLRRATELAPDYEVAWYNLGAAAARAEAWEESERALRRALQLAPRSPEALASLGWTLLNRKQYAAAIPPLEQALALTPDNRRARLNLAFCLEQIGEFEKAKAHRARAGAGAR
jgi:tetratricopeptide (TPR) repeat protein